MKLTTREWDFLVRLRGGLKLRPADRQDDRARQKMRKAGYAEVVMSPRRWLITEAGRRALENTNAR